MKNVLVPRNIEDRKSILKKNIFKWLQQEAIESDISIDEMYDFPEELVNVRKVYGNVRLSNSVHSFPKWLKNVEIYGNFYCSVNKLGNLVGSPKLVTGDFSCVKAGLSSLRGSPKYVGGNFRCELNYKISLAHRPKKICGILMCDETVTNIGTGTVIGTRNGILEIIF